jgi:hypothetical protein
MASNTLPGSAQVRVVFDGGNQTLAVAAAGSASRPLPGALVAALVLTTSTAALNIYDNAAGDASGTQIGVVPSGTAVGTLIRFTMPASLGISARGQAGSPGVTLALI